jgi:hypothetical protein
MNFANIFSALQSKSRAPHGNTAFVAEAYRWRMSSRTTQMAISKAPAKR